MIARLLIPVIVLTVLPYLWIDRKYLHIPKGKRKILYWLPAAIVIGYTAYLTLEPDFLPANPVFIDIWFVMMALLAVPQFVFAFTSFVGWECMKLSRRFKAKKGDGRFGGSVHRARNWGKLVGIILAVWAFFSFIYGFTMGVHFRAVLAMPDSSVSYQVEVTVSFDGQLKISTAGA